MEYLAHGDLHRYLCATSQIPENETKEITYQLLEGLCFMHDNGFIHRDLKPCNVLLKSKPPGIWWVKIGDFGVSKRAAAGTAPSTLKGTLGFLAPELHGYIEATGKKSDSESKAADIWALGETMHQMLTREVTFTTLLDLNRYAQGRMGFPFDRLKHHGVSSDGQQFIRQLMAPTPKERLTAQNAIQQPWVVIGKDPLPNAELALPSPPQPSIATNDPAPASSGKPSNKWSTLEPDSSDIRSTAELPNNPSSVPTRGDSEQPTQDVDMINSFRDVSNGNLGTNISRTSKIAQKLRGKSLRSLSNFEQERRTELTSKPLTVITPTDGPGSSMAKKTSRAQTAESQSLVRKFLRSFKSPQDSADGTLRAESDAEEENIDEQTSQRLLLYRMAPHAERITPDGILNDIRQSADSLSLSRYGEKAISITNYLITTGNIRRESVIEILDTERKDKRQIVLSNEDIYEVMCSPNGRLAASRGMNAIVLWDTSTGSTLHMYRGFGGVQSSPFYDRVQHLWFSPNSRMFGTWANGCIYGWDVDSGKQTFTIPLKSFDCQQINTIAFLPSGEVLAAGVYSRTVTHPPHRPVTAAFLVLFEPDHQTPRYFHEIDILATSDSVYPLGLSTDSTKVAFFFPGYSEIGDIHFFDVSTGEPIWTLCPQSMTPPKPLCRTHALLTTPTVAILATGHYTGLEYITFLSVWDVQTRKFLASRVIYHGSEKACRLSFSRDGSTLVIGGEKGTIILVRADFASLRGKKDTYGYNYMSRQERWLTV
ncbi:hypothetical protein AWENTII_005949 [Aspergillus wentii]